MASANETVLLKSTLEIQNKAYSVKLTASEIYWEVITSARASGGPYSEPLVKAENQSVKLTEVIAVRLESKTGGNEGKFQHLEMVALNATAFSIYVVHRLHRHRWRDRRVTFHSKDSSVIQQWVEKIQDILLKPELNRPKKLLVFINPFGGKKRGLKTYHDKVAPLFDLAGISTDVIVTQRANHARDTLLEYDLGKVDGVVAVGGDGMFSELMHGMLTRTMREAGVDHPTPTTPLIQPALRLGIIPGGSTDTVAWTTTGYHDPVTSTLHIIVGDSVAIDVATVHHGNQFLRYNVSLLGYGYYGDCIVDSESIRWMGPGRYKWSGFKKMIGNRGYEGEISFLPSLDKDNHPRDRTQCRVGCQVCQNEFHSADPGNGNGGSPDEITADKEVWQTVKGRFLAINSFAMSCKCSLSPEGPAPSAHLGDGCADLILIHETSRSDFSKHLMRCIDKKADQFDFPFINIHRVREFKFRPMVEDVDDTHEATDSKQDGQQRLRSRTTHNSVWNCDGEVIEEPSIDLRMHRHALKLFARGVEEDVKEEENGGCLNCACVRRT